MFHRVPKQQRINWKTVELLDDFRYDNTEPPTKRMKWLWYKLGINKMSDPLIVQQGFRHDYATTRLAQFLGASLVFLYHHLTGMNWGIDSVVLMGVILYGFPKIGKYYWKQAILHDVMYVNLEYNYLLTNNVMLFTMIEEWVANEPHQIKGSFSRTRYAWQDRNLIMTVMRGLLAVGRIAVSAWYFTRIIFIYLTVLSLSWIMYYDINIKIKYAIKRFINNLTR